MRSGGSGWAGVFFGSENVGSNNDDNKNDDDLGVGVLVKTVSE